MNYYYISSTNKAEGPVSAEQLQTLLAAGTITPTTKIAPVGSQEWVPLATAIPVPANADNMAAPLSVHPSNPIALVSLILSCLGLPLSFLCCIGLMILIAGIVCGHIGLSKAKNFPQAGGRGLALAGTIVGYTGLVLYVAMMLLFGALSFVKPDFLKELGNELNGNTGAQHEQYEETEEDDDDGDDAVTPPAPPVQTPNNSAKHQSLTDDE